MEDQPKGKWYFKTSTFIIAILCIGPFALPLAWANPHYSRMTKIVVTIVVLALTYAMGKLLVSSIKSLAEYYKEALG